MEPPSGSPITAAVDVLGDRWTLLVLRDIIFFDRRHFRALLTGSTEGIASNILADRLKRLLDAGLLARGGAAVRGQRARFSLTEAGIRTLPIICALGRWGVDWRSASDDSPAWQLLRDEGPAIVEELMDELRVRHLEAAANPHDGPGAFERLAAAGGYPA